MGGPGDSGRYRDLGTHVSVYQRPNLLWTTMENKTIRMGENKVFLEFHLFTSERQRRYSDDLRSAHRKLFEDTPR